MMHDKKKDNPTQLNENNDANLEPTQRPNNPVKILLISGKKITNKYISFNNKLMNTRKKGLEPLAFGFEDHCSTDWTILFILFFIF